MHSIPPDPKKVNEIRRNHRSAQKNPSVIYPEITSTYILEADKTKEALLPLWKQCDSYTVLRLIVSIAIPASISRTNHKAI